MHYTGVEGVTKVMIAVDGMNIRQARMNIGKEGHGCMADPGTMFCMCGIFLVPTVEIHPAEHISNK